MSRIVRGGVLRGDGSARPRHSLLTPGASSPQGFEVRLSDTFGAPLDLSWEYPDGGSVPRAPCTCMRIVSGDEYAPLDPWDPSADFVYAGCGASHQDDRALGTGLEWYRCYHAYAIHRRSYRYTRRRAWHVVDDFDRPDENPIALPWQSYAAILGGHAELLSGRIKLSNGYAAYEPMGTMRSPGWRFRATVDSYVYDWYAYIGRILHGSILDPDYGLQFDIDAEEDWVLSLEAGTQSLVIASDNGDPPTMDIDIRLTSDWSLQAYTSVGDGSFTVAEENRVNGGVLVFYGIYNTYVDDVEAWMVST